MRCDAWPLVNGKICSTSEWDRLRTDSSQRADVRNEMYQMR